MNDDKAALLTFLTHTRLIDPATAATIAGYFNPVSINQNEFFLKAGRICNEYLFLETGFMRAYTLNTEGAEITTGFYPARRVVFEVASYFQRNASKESIQALTPCTGWVITYEQFQELFHTQPLFREFARSLLVRGLVAMKERMLNMITQTAEERYENLLQQHPELLQQAPLKYIATYLGVTDTSLSRIRKELLKK
jgi:CRP-like cAMP-binding protein